MERAGYMLRKGDHKLNYYVGHEPELFDLAADPDEMTDVAASSAYAGVRVELTEELRSIVNPWPATGPDGARTVAQQLDDSC